MFFNKNGLKVNLDFKNSIDEKELSNLEKNNNNKTLIRKESNLFLKSEISITSNKTEKLKKLEQYSFNLSIKSKIKKTKDLIINKISNFKLVNNAIKNKEKEADKNFFEIIKLDNLNIITSKKIIESEPIIDNENNNIKEKETDLSPPIEKKLFLNLNCCSDNKLFIERKKKINFLDIQNRINDIEIKRNLKQKCFELIDVVNKVNDIKIDGIQIEKKEELNIKNNEIKENITDKIFSIESNVILLDIKGKKKYEKKEEFSIQNNIINFKIIHQNNKKLFINISQNHIINFEIKRKKKKLSNFVLKKVDNFGNASNKLYLKDKSNKEMILTGENDNTNANKKNEKKRELNLNSKINKLKTKSPNQIQIKIKNDNQNNNFNLSENNSNKYNKNKLINLPNEENKNTITINNEITYNKQSIEFPVINTDILQLEEQYEKIKKELNDLYPIFKRNKQYRENFFMQLSQGNQSKYTFYLSLYKIIKDEQEEKKNNNYYDNYLKMKKIMKENNYGTQYKMRKLKPFKKNKSSHYILAKDKTSPLYTEE